MGATRGETPTNKDGDPAILVLNSLWIFTDEKRIATKVTTMRFEIDTTFRPGGVISYYQTLLSRP